MRWVQDLHDIAKKASAVAVTKRMAQAHAKYIGIINQLPDEFTVWDVQRVTGIDHPKAVQLIKRIREHGLISKGRRVPQHFIFTKK
jgi:hypothetical protein